MKLETYREIIRQISDKPRTIGLTIMGEPLINKRIVEFVRIGKAAGHTIGLTTNATLLDEAISEQLLSAGLDSLLNVGVAGVIVGPVVMSLFVASARIYEREREGDLTDAAAEESPQGPP